MLKQQITANGGELFQLGMKWSKPKHYYLISDKANLTKLGKAVRELQGTLLNYLYIKDCIAKKELLSTQLYEIQLPRELTSSSTQLTLLQMFKPAEVVYKTQSLVELPHQKTE